MRLLFHADAKGDLQELVQAHRKFAARLIELLREVRGNARLVDMLTVQDFGADGQELIHVSRWHEHWRAGKDIWRLKFWELEHQGFPYRVIYALKRGTGDHYVLAIPHRNFDYGLDHPITQRILRAYDDL